MNPVLEKGLGADAVRAFLSRGKGMNIDTFDEDSALTFGHLYESYRKREMVLFIDEKTGMAAIARRSVQSLIHAEGMVLIEAQRTFANGKVVPMSGDYSTKETCLQGESERKAAQRGTWEELNLYLDEDLFVQIIEKHRFVQRMSYVYANVLSVASVTLFHVYLDERPWREEIRNHIDTDIMVTTRWIQDPFRVEKSR